MKINADSLYICFRLLEHGATIVAKTNMLRYRLQTQNVQEVVGPQSISFQCLF